MSKKSKTLRNLAAGAASALALAGCASMSPLDSSEQARAVFTSNAARDACLTDIAACAARVPVGTERSEVFNMMGLNPASARVLSREETNRVLYGEAQLQIPFEQREAAQALMDRQQGISFVDTTVISNRSLGLTNSKTRSEGIAYTFNMVFMDGKLYSPVTYTATPVNEVRTKGHLDGFNPLNIIPGL